MFRILTVMACAAGAALVASPVQASVFEYSFTASMWNSPNVYKGKGLLWGDDADGDGTFAITRATGTVTIRDNDTFAGVVVGGAGSIYPGYYEYTARTLGLSLLDDTTIFFRQRIESGLQYSAVKGSEFAGNSVMTIFPYDGFIAPVPEPATWAMMVMGFTLTGLAVRRRRGRTTIRLA